MAYMLKNNTLFNQPIGNWDTSNVENMYSVFSENLSFNQDIGSWNVNKVTNMRWMFKGAVKFNQVISDWNTSAVKHMGDMFKETDAFNQDISNWNTSAVTTMSYMFQDATKFNQDLSEWNVCQVTEVEDFNGNNSVLDADNKPEFDSNCYVWLANGYSDTLGYNMVHFLALESADLTDIGKNGTLVRDRHERVIPNN